MLSDFIEKSINICIYRQRYQKSLEDINLIHLLSSIYTLSGRIGKVVASHAAVARSIPAEVALIYTIHEALRGYCP